MTSDQGVGPEFDETDEDGDDDQTNRAPEFEGSSIIGRTALTLEDFTAVWAALPQNRRIFTRFGLWIVLIPLFWLINSMLDAGGSDRPSHLSWPLVSLLVLIFGAALAFGLWRGRNMWARNALADLRGTEGVEFRFDSAGVSLQAPGRQSTSAWSSLYRSLETAHAFAIYTAPAMVMVVPKRAFSADELVRLRAQLLRLVPNRQLRGTQIVRPLARTALLWLVLVIAFLVIWQFLSPK